MTVAKALVEATKCQPTAGEEAQVFLDRLVRAANGLEDDEFEQLPGPVQKWMDTAIGAVEAGEKIPEPKDLDKVMKATNGAGGAASTKKTKKTAKVEVTEETEEAAPKKKGAKKAAAKKAAPKKAAKKKAKGGGTGRPRVSDDAKLHWTTKPKDVPDGNRNQYFDKLKEGTLVKDLRKTKKLLRVTRYLRRKGYVELVGA